MEGVWRVGTVCVGEAASDEAVHLLIRRDKEAPEHAADPSPHRRVIRTHELHAEPLELADDGGGHATVQVDAHLPPRVGLGLGLPLP